MVSLSTKLKQGDIVEIITTKNQKPNPGWLDKVFSKHARTKLLSQLNTLFAKKEETGGNFRKPSKH
jgi:GTP pyrophosphokinase